MAQKINPTSYRLAKSLDWRFKNIVLDQKDESYFISEQTLIRNIIEKINKSKNILTSEILILRTEKQIQIKYLYYYGKNNKNLRKWQFYMLKFLLERLLLKSVYLEVKRIPSVVLNSKILNEYLKNEIQKNPRKYKSTLKWIISEHKKWFK